MLPTLLLLGCWRLAFGYFLLLNTHTHTSYQAVGCWRLAFWLLNQFLLLNTHTHTSFIRLLAVGGWIFLLLNTHTHTSFIWLLAVGCWLLACFNLSSLFIFFMHTVLKTLALAHTSSITLVFRELGTRPDAIAIWNKEKFQKNYKYSATPSGLKSQLTS